MSGGPATRGGKSHWTTDQRAMALLRRVYAPESTNYRPAVITMASATDKGLRRSWNEDAMLSKQFDVTVNGDKVTRAVIAVADGIGGASAGDVASGIAIRVLEGGMKEMLSESRPLENGEIPIGMEEIFKKALGALKEYSRDHWGIRMGTTLTAVVMDGGMAYIGHIGDSKAYRIRDGVMEKMTVDHNLKDQGLGHILNRALATGDSVIRTTPDVELSLSMREGDILIVCSDGLENCEVPDLVIQETMIKNKNSLERGCEELVELANRHGGRDNISIIAAKIE